MAIISFPSQNIYPTKPKTANYYSNTATQNTWFTVLDVTSGTGILSRIAVTSGISGIYNSNIEIRITIDGIENNLTNSSGQNLNVRGMTHRIHSVTDYSYNGLCAFYYDTQTYFYKSLKVEIRNTNATTNIMEAITDYSIV